MRDDGADNTSEVSGSEGDTELSSLAIRFLGLSEDAGIEELHDLLEEEELGHGIGNLVNGMSVFCMAERREEIYLTRP